MKEIPRLGFYFYAPLDNFWLWQPGEFERIEGKYRNYCEFPNSPQDNMVSLCESTASVIK